MNKNDEGYIVVETIGVFIPFVLLVVSILSLVNIVTLQTRVHYSLTQAANTLAMYSYTLHITGVADGLQILDYRAGVASRGAEEIISDIGGVLDGINNLSFRDTMIHGLTATNRVTGAGESIADDPVAAMQLVLNYALNEGRNILFGELVRPLFGRYLSNGGMTGDEYLRSVNVIGGLDGLDFYEFSLPDPSGAGASNSVLIDQFGDVRLVVQYEIEYKIGTLPLPFEPKLKVTQQVRTKAWLNGRGEGYW